MTQSDRGGAPKALVGLIGSGIGQSLSPLLHEEEARCQGLRLHYQVIDLDRTGSDATELPVLLRAARTMGFAGLNVTHPCKQAVVALLDELSDEARAIGAVNTVVVSADRLVGHNTDCSGFGMAFGRRLPDAALDRVVLLGAGGAGAAVAHAALRLGVADLTVIDQDARRAQALAAGLAQQYPGARVQASADVERALGRADGLIHATPTGMDAHPGLPIDADLLRADLWVAEIVYFPIETALLRAARERGCRTVDGGGMAVWQAVGAFELFTGIRPDAERMEAHFRRLIAQRAPRAA